jgi:hypothetical protein
MGPHAVSDERGEVPRGSVIASNVHVEPFGQKRRRQLIAHVAVRTRHPGSAARAGVFAFPWPAEMVLAYPATVVAKRAGYHPNGSLNP